MYKYIIEGNETILAGTFVHLRQPMFDYATCRPLHRVGIRQHGEPMTFASKITMRRNNLIDPCLAKICIVSYSNHRQVEVSDNGYDGAGGIQTSTLGIQVGVVAVNDPPEVIAPPPGKAVPGETTALPGFLVVDPDTGIGGKLAEEMLKVRLVSPWDCETIPTWPKASLGLGKT